MLQHDEFRWFVAAIGDRQKAAHLQCLQLFAIQHFDIQLEFLCQFLCGIGKIGRRADVAWQIAEFLGQVDAVCNSDGLRNCVLRVRCIGSGDCEYDFLHAAFDGFLLAFQCVGAVHTFTRSQHCRLDCPGGIAILDAIQR